MAVALSLVGTQVVVDAREDAAAARLASVPGVFPPLGDELVVVRTISDTDAYNLWSGVEIGDARTAALLVAPDGSQSFTAVDQRTGEALWSTPWSGRTRGAPRRPRTATAAGARATRHAGSPRPSPCATPPTGSCGTRTTGRRANPRDHQPGGGARHR